MTVEGFSMSPSARTLAEGSEVVTVDEKLKIKLPDSICKPSQITPGTRLLVGMEPTTGEIVAYVVARPGVQLAEARMEMNNTPGTMAKVAQRIGENNVNIIMFVFPPSTARTLSGVMLLDLSKSGRSIKQLEKAIKDLAVVRSLKIHYK